MTIKCSIYFSRLNTNWAITQWCGDYLLQGNNLFLCNCLFMTNGNNFPPSSLILTEKYEEISLLPSFFFSVHRLAIYFGPFKTFYQLAISKFSHRHNIGVCIIWRYPILWKPSTLHIINRYTIIQILAITAKSTQNRGINAGLFLGYNIQSPNSI